MPFVNTIIYNGKKSNLYGEFLSYQNILVFCFALLVSLLLMYSFWFFSLKITKQEKKIPFSCRSLVPDMVVGIYSEISIDIVCATDVCSKRKFMMIEKCVLCCVLFNEYRDKTHIRHSRSVVTWCMVYLLKIAEKKYFFSYKIFSKPSTTMLFI